jgi:hypothetical protein
LSDLAERTPAMPEPTPETMEAAYAAVMDGELPPEVGDPTITARAIQERIRNSDSFDDVFKAQSLTPWAELIGEVVTVGGFHLNPSTQEGGSAVYAVVSLRRDGEDDFMPYSCGGANVLTQLLKAWEQGWFPFQASLVSKKTSKNFDTYWIEAVK